MFKLTKLITLAPEAGDAGRGEDCHDHPEDPPLAQGGLAQGRIDTLPVALEGHKPSLEASLSRGFDRVSRLRWGISALWR